MSEAYECKILVISCIDFRFVTKLRDYLVDQDLKGSYDLITVPGASLNIGEVLETIGLSFKLHNPKEVYIFDHEDCGAYGTSDSLETHKENLRRAKEIINKEFGAKVKNFVATFDN